MSKRAKISNAITYIILILMVIVNNYVGITLKYY